MKIKKVSIKDYKGLKNLDINFENENGILNIVVLAGSNGSGKTRVLESIYKYFENTINDKVEKNKIEICFEKKEKEVDNILQNKSTDIFKSLKNYNSYKKGNSIYSEGIIENIEKLEKFPKIIYIPTEINFQKIKTETTNFEVEYKFLNVVNSDVIKDISSYISTKVIKTMFKEKELTTSQAMDKVFKEINEIFEILELDVKVSTISENGNSPVFVNFAGEKFDINELSSGEKQLFLRTLAIKMLEPENSIIMIDEPELSLHPKWQSMIVSVYQKIGKNNQIILATHSPHILGSVEKENIKVLYKDNSEIKIKNGEELYNSYGQPIGRILEDIMDLESDRNPEVFKQLNEINELVDNNEYETREFKDKYEKLKEILGEDDKELFLIDMDIQRKRGNINDKSK